MSIYGQSTYGEGVYGGGPLAPDDNMGTPPLLDASPWERAAYQGGAKPIARLTVESGGGDPVELTIKDQDVEVTRTMTRGTHWLAEVTVLREPGQDTEDRVMTPGALFRLEHGWDYGGGVREWRPFGVYQMAKVPTLDRADALKLDLHDRWAQIAECERVAPIAGLSYIDAGAIGSLVHEVDPTIRLDINKDDWFALPAPLPGEVSRSGLIVKMAQAAGFYPHFGDEGQFVIDPAPFEQPPVASLSDGVNATLTSVKVEAVFSTPYNAVILERDGVAPYVLHLADVSSPRHRSKPGMGMRPYRTQLPEYFPAARVAGFARDLLSQLVGGIQRRTFSTWGRGDLSPGDWISAIEAGTYLMPQRSSVSMVEEIRHNPLTVATEIVTRSTPRVLTEEG